MIIPLSLERVSFRQHIVVEFALYKLCFLICAFTPFTFSVIISMLRLTSAILFFVFCLFSVF